MHELAFGNIIQENTETVANTINSAGYMVEGYVFYFTNLWKN